MLTVLGGGPFRLAYFSRPATHGWLDTREQCQFTPLPLQSTSTKPISRSHANWVSTSNSLLDGSSSAQEMACRNCASRHLALWHLWRRAHRDPAPSTPPSSPPLAGCPVQPENSKTSNFRLPATHSESQHALCFTPNRPIPIGSATK
jgi:hypothetical protein